MPPKRRGGTGSRRGPIPIDDARTNFAVKPLPINCVATEHGSSQAKSGIVGFFDGGGKVGDAEQLEARGENLLVGTTGHIGHVDESGREYRRMFRVRRHRLQQGASQRNQVILLTQRGFGGRCGNDRP